MAQDRKHAPGRVPARKTKKPRPEFLVRAVTRAITRTAAVEGVDPEAFLAAQDEMRKLQEMDLAVAFEQADALNDKDMDDLMDGLIGLNINRTMSEKTSKMLPSSSRLDWFFKRPEMVIKRKVLLARRKVNNRLEQEQMEREQRMLAEGGKKREGVVGDKDRKVGGWMSGDGEQGSAGGWLNGSRAGEGGTGNWQQKWGN